LKQDSASGSFGDWQAEHTIAGSLRGYAPPPPVSSIAARGVVVALALPYTWELVRLIALETTSNEADSPARLVRAFGFAGWTP
jgi:hypothetical protein